MAIARAVYSQADTIILDDCLSAVDAHTAKHLYEHCITGNLGAYNITSVLDFFSWHRLIVYVSSEWSNCYSCDTSCCIMS